MQFVLPAGLEGAQLPRVNLATAAQGGPLRSFAKYLYCLKVSTISLGKVAQTRAIVAVVNAGFVVDKSELAMPRAVIKVECAAWHLSLYIKK